MIRAHQLTRRFGSLTAVDRMDLSLGDRGVVGLLGPNGAGKTTTMRMLSGTLPQTSGVVEICGVDLFEEPARARAHVGWLPERPPLYDELTVGEMLGFAAELRGVARRGLAARVGRVLEQVGLVGWERRLVGGLSKGYRQRVGLAQALVHDPPVLVLDEATTGLDPLQLVPIRALLRQLGTERLVVVSTHILTEVEAVCGRIVLLHRGRVAGDGTAEELAVAAGAGPWLELRLGDRQVDHCAGLAAVDGVRQVERLEPGRYRLLGGPGLADLVARAAVAHGWVVVEIRLHQASLERAFLGLTRGGR